jgi:hypothetical protein
MACIGIAVAGCNAESAPPIAPPPSSFIALTPNEYNNTVRDLLSMPSDGAAWPKAPPVAEKLGTVIEDTGAFDGTAIARRPFPWVFPKEIGVDDFEGMADGQVPSIYGVEELQKAGHAAAVPPAHRHGQG